MNRSFTIIALFSVAAIVGYTMFSSDAPTLHAQQAGAQRASVNNSAAQQADRTTFQYATLTTRVSEDPATSRPVYEIAWNSGDTLVNVSSRVSLEDAYRNMITRRRGTAGRINLLSTLLNHFGGEGWELLETQNTGSVNSRVFIRR